MIVSILNKDNICISNIVIDDPKAYKLQHGEIRIVEDAGNIGWLYENGIWSDPNKIEITTEQKIVMVRNRRNRLLKKHVDTMNPIRWETLNQSQKDEWAKYRQSLLDIPDQEGFPNNVIWPVVPKIDV